VSAGFAGASGRRAARSGAGAAGSTGGGGAGNGADGTAAGTGTGSGCLRPFPRSTAIRIATPTRQATAMPIRSGVIIMGYSLNSPMMYRQRGRAAGPRSRVAGGGLEAFPDRHLRRLGGLGRRGRPDALQHELEVVRVRRAGEPLLLGDRSVEDELGQRLVEALHLVEVGG